MALKFKRPMMWMKSPAIPAALCFAGPRSVLPLCFESPGPCSWQAVQVIDIHDSGLRAPRTINAVEGSPVASKMGGVPDYF